MENARLNLLRRSSVDRPKHVSLHSNAQLRFALYLSCETRGAQTMMAMGVDTRLQDPIDGVVYQIVEPNGQWVSYSKIDYIRTRKGNEKAGTLSLKKAEEWGFKL